MMKKLFLTLLLVVLCLCVFAKARIGMLVAVEQETIFEKYGKPAKEDCFGGFNIYCYNFKKYSIYVVKSGVGELAAASAVQILIDKYNVESVINFGVAGGLTPDMRLSKVCIVEKVVHYDFDLSSVDPVKKCQYPGYDDIYINTDSKLLTEAHNIFPDLRLVTCASADKFVSSEAKSSLSEEFSAQICEMEAAGVLLTCIRNKVPCLIIKAISDGLTGGGEEYYMELKKSASFCFDVTNEIIKKIYLVK